MVCETLTLGFSCVGKMGRGELIVAKTRYLSPSDRANAVISFRKPGRLRSGQWEKVRYFRYFEWAELAADTSRYSSRGPLTPATEMCRTREREGDLGRLLPGNTSSS